MDYAGEFLLLVRMAGVTVRNSGPGDSFGMELSSLLASGRAAIAEACRTRRETSSLTGPGVIELSAEPLRRQVAEAVLAHLAVPYRVDAAGDGVRIEPVGGEPMPWLVASAIVAVMVERLDYITDVCPGEAAAAAAVWIAAMGIGRDQ